MFGLYSMHGGKSEGGLGKRTRQEHPQVRKKYLQRLQKERRLKTHLSQRNLEKEWHSRVELCSVSSSSDRLSVSTTKGKCGGGGGSPHSPSLSQCQQPLQQQHLIHHEEEEQLEEQPLTSNQEDESSDHLSFNQNLNYHSRLCRHHSRFSNVSSNNNNNNNTTINTLHPPLHAGSEGDAGLVSAGLDTLVRLFSCLLLNRDRPPSYRKPPTDMHGHGGRYSYSALEDDGSAGGGERLEMDRKVAVASRGTTRDTAGMAARAFCRTQPRYSLSEHLHEVGSRIDKNWFLIRDISVKTERLMTLLPLDEGCPVSSQPGTKEALIELFQAIQHPYIYPVLDIDFVTISTHTYVITVIPYNNKGTLKDLIYRSQWREDWAQKYQQRAAGLPVKQVQRLGRQILEALLYLQDRGFPPSGHIHSGNVILQNGVARIGGLENTLLGLTSRIYPIIRRRLRDNKDAIDSVCFGHVLFEMCAGYELSAAHPSPKHLEDISGYPQIITVLEYIFGCGENYPSVEEILCCDFFRNLDLREMRAMPLPSQFQLPYSAPVRAILKEVRRHQKQKSEPLRTQSLSRKDYTYSQSSLPRELRKGKRPAGASTNTEGGGSTPTSSEASTSGCGGTGEDPSGVGGGGGAYSSPGKTSSPTVLPVPSDTSPSPEHSAHRNLGSRSPQRKGAITPSSPEIYHTPPLTPPTTTHYLHSHHPTPEHDHSIETSTSTISTSHTNRPLSTTKSKLCSDSLSSAAFDYLESRGKINPHHHYHHHRRSKSPLLSPTLKNTHHQHASPINKSAHKNPQISIGPSPTSESNSNDIFLSPYYTPKHNASLLHPQDAIMNFQPSTHQNMLSNNQNENIKHLKRNKT